MESLVIISVLLFCHYLADYTHLSMPFMLKAKKIGKPLFPIFIHACVHGLLMFIALLILGEEIENIIMAVVLQIFSHFIIDFLKGKMNVWFTELQSPLNVWHWIVFGIDQYFHQIIILLMTYIIIYK